MGKSNSKEVDKSTNNVAPVQNISVENSLSTHDIVQYILLFLTFAIILFIAIGLWCMKNGREQKRVKKELTELKLLRQDFNDLKKVVVHK